jgi:hypothetical protein
MPLPYCASVQSVTRFRDRATFSARKLQLRVKP